jgi:uncharacterized membrane-anchored protein
MDSDHTSQVEIALTGVTRTGHAHTLLAQTLRKVPAILIYFWTVKVLTTALGESTSDYLVHRLVPEIAVGLGAIGFVVSLVLQFSVRQYIAWVYWLAVTMVAIFGTMCADVLHIRFGVPYVASTVFFAVSLAVVFAVWYGVERTLSIHSIFTRRRELFYWAAVVTTFALGTAAGDMTARSMNLGYFWSGVMFAGLIAIPAVAYRLGANPIVTFWFAYILTRPLGASFADWFGKSKALGGLGLGDAIVSLVLTLSIIAFVAYLTLTRVDVEDETRPQAS